jgi:hypothetical protein
MRGRSIAVSMTALATAVGVALLLVGAGVGATRSGYPLPRLGPPKLDSQLGQVARTAAANGAAAAMTQARADGVQSSGNDVRVIVVARPGSETGARTAIRSAGGTAGATAGPLIEALVPPASLVSLSSSAAVARVRPPLPHVATAVDEGVQLTDADTWHTAGFGGTGVKIGIIDLGFAGYSSLLGTALPASVTAVNYCGTGQPSDFSTTEHGTAVAEIVHQMAPGAQLYLFCIDSEVALHQAEQDAIADGIKIVNHSVAWFDTSRGDGTGDPGTPDATVADARAHGILWVNAAGNFGFDHWAGGFTPDASNPVYNDFSPGVA